MTEKRCRYCKKYLGDDKGYCENNNYCKYNTPDCTTEARNFKAMHSRLLNSNDEQIRNFAVEIKERLKTESPKSLKPLMKYLSKRKTIDNLFIPTIKKYKKKVSVKSK